MRTVAGMKVPTGSCSEHFVVVRQVQARRGEIGIVQVAVVASAAAAAVVVVVVVVVGAACMGVASIADLAMDHMRMPVAHHFVEFEVRYLRTVAAAAVPVVVFAVAGKPWPTPAGIGGATAKLRVTDGLCC